MRTYSAKVQREFDEWSQRRRDVYVPIVVLFLFAIFAVLLHLVWR